MHTLEDVMAAELASDALNGLSTPVAAVAEASPKRAAEPTANTELAPSTLALDSAVACATEVTASFAVTSALAFAVHAPDASTTVSAVVVASPLAVQETNCSDDTAPVTIASPDT